MSSPLVVIVGVTASGKSALAMQIAKRFNGEIICADSRTVYKGMDIGTAKPSKHDQEKIRHHLIDVIEPNQAFSVADFKRLANKAIKDISSRNKLPIMVGGSGLYVDSVIFDYNFGRPADSEQRTQLSSLDIEKLIELCRLKDIELPENYLNKRYLIRAIESGGVVKHELSLRPNTIVVGIATEKSELLQRIEQRTDEMIKLGVIEEVRNLGGKYGWDGEAMKGNIYPIFRKVAEGSMGIEEARSESIRSDVKLVKKQLTWFKRNPHIVWNSPKQLIGEIEQFVDDHKDQDSI